MSIPKVAWPVCRRSPGATCRAEMCSLHRFILSPVTLTSVFQVTAPLALIRQGRLLLPQALFCCDYKNSPKFGHHIPSLTGTAVLMMGPLSNTCSLLRTPFMPCEGQVPMVLSAISYVPKSLNVPHTKCSVSHLNKPRDSKFEGVLRLLGNPFLF